MPARMPRLMTWRPGSRMGLPLMRPDSFRKAMIEPEKVIAPMATPRPSSTRLTGLMSAGDGVHDAEGAGVEEGRGADQHGGEADEAVEAGDQFRHRRHLDVLGDVTSRCRHRWRWRRR